MTTKPLLLDLAFPTMPATGAAGARPARLDMDAADVALLRAIHPRLSARQAAMTETFYAHLLQMPALRGWFRDAAASASLKQAYVAYFVGLSAGDYGPAYIAQRQRVGAIHHHIGLSPQCYLDAYRHYLTQLALVLQELLAGQPALFLPTQCALMKVVTFDMSLAFDTYIAAGQAQLGGFKRYAERIVDSMPSGLMVLDEDGRVRTLNTAARRMFGLLPGQGGEGAAYTNALPDSRLRAWVARALAQPGQWSEMLLSVTVRTEPLCHLHCHLSRVLQDGQPLLLLVVEDVTLATLVRSRLQDSEERFRVAFGQAAVGLAQVAPDGRWLRVNQKLTQITGYSEAELLGMRLRDLNADDDAPRDAEVRRRLQRREIDHWSVEQRYRHQRGHPVWVNVTLSLMQAGPEAAEFIVVIEDISQRRQFQQQLQHLAHHDPLTGLANRALLLDRLSQSIAYAQRAGRHVAVLFIDLDRFKHVNDSLGHDAGDQVIIEIGRRLAAGVRQSDTVARLGGDEFVVLLSDMGRADRAEPLAHKLLDTLLAPIQLAGQELTLGGSIGVSLYPKDGADNETLLKNADAAMYRAKQAGRSNVQFYAEEMNGHALARLQTEAGLRHALERHEFTLRYQPQTDCASGRLVGAAVQLHWQPAGAPLQLPHQFLAIAEEAGLLVPIGEWLLRSACDQLAAWRVQGAPGLDGVRLVLKLSARQFRHPGLEQAVRLALASSGCGAGALGFEMDQAVIMEQPERGIDTLQRLHGLGAHLTIDDFGLGSASLRHLKRMPVDALKVGRCFIDGLAGDGDGADAVVVDAIGRLARGFRLQVIGEAGDGAGAPAALRAAGCDIVQRCRDDDALTAQQLQQLAAFAARPAQ